MLENNYISLALNDRKFLLQFLIDDENAFNRQAVDCEQVVEKLMKGVLENIEMDDFRLKGDLLHSHNLKKIGNVINEYLHINLSLESLAYLKDFYYEARYPGDDFIVVSKSMRDRCLEIMNTVLKELSPFIEGDALQEMNLFK